jgi:hypothetical protein
MLVVWAMAEVSHSCVLAMHAPRGWRAIVKGQMKMVEKVDGPDHLASNLGMRNGKHH